MTQHTPTHVIVVIGQSKTLILVMDCINQRYGRGTVRLASENSGGVETQSGAAVAMLHDAVAGYYGGEGVVAVVRCGWCQGSQWAGRLSLQEQRLYRMDTGYESL